MAFNADADKTELSEDQPCEDQPVRGCAIEEIKDGVRIEKRDELGGVSLVAAKKFAPREVVLFERALVVARQNTNIDRVRAYCCLPAEERNKLRHEYCGEEATMRCAATAPCREDALSGDSAADVFSMLLAEGYEVTSGEVEAVIRVWNLNAYDRALAPLACKVAHSCAPNVFVRVDTQMGVVEATACRDINEGDALGSWYSQDTGLFWMGADVRRAMLEAQRGFACACVRCSGPDVCRSLPCRSCAKGSMIPQGVAASEPWRCSKCGSGSTPDQTLIAAESSFAPRVLLELKPPKNHKVELDELRGLSYDIRDKLGPEHWCAAAADLVVHFRSRSSDGASVESLAYGIRFLGWFISRGLPMPPAGVIRTPLSIAMDASETISRGTLPNISDGRTLVARILMDFLLPLFESSGDTVATVGNTGARIAGLQTWLEQMRATCGYCGAALGKSSACCGRCKQVRYCGKECQTNDWKRHKTGCLPHTESLASTFAMKVLLPSA